MEAKEGMASSCEGNRDTETQPWEEWSPEPHSQVGGCQVSQWSGPGPGPQRMECARKHLGKGLEKASE